ncbi:retrovirus-related pol polyprotein from transposon TNT 1-94, partial [Tanacetum coccineum]
KSKKQTLKPKSEDTNQEPLYLLHMDLCGPMRVASVNEKKYILVIVVDNSRFIWVKFLHLKDEAPEFIKKFLKMIQVRLKATVRRIRTDNVFDELLNPPANVVSQVLVVVAPFPKVVAPVPDDSTGNTSSTNVDQEAPSPKENHDIEVAHMDNDPYFGIPILKIHSEESSSSDVILINVHFAPPISEHNNK